MTANICILFNVENISLFNFENIDFNFYFFYFSHKHLESYGECSENDIIDEDTETGDEDLETELCLNEKSSNVQGADVLGTLKSGWPPCQGKLTFIKSNGEKMYV